MIPYCPGAPCVVMSPHQCSPVPPHQCHLINATYKCPSVLPIS
ncbi:unnamed protein product, partial [Staurois parvus]